MPQARSEESAPTGSTAEMLLPLVQKLPDGVTLVERDGRISFANEAAATLLGFAGAEMLGGADHGALAAQYLLMDEAGQALPGDRLPTRLAFQERRPVEALVRFRSRATQVERCALVSSTPAFDAAGAVERVLTVFRDVSERQRSEQVLRFLASATSMLGESLDLEQTLQAVVRAAVPVLSDWCALELVQPEGPSRMVAVAHPDPEKMKLAWELREKWPDDPNAETGVPKVLRTGEPDAMALIPPELIEKGARSPEHLRVLRALGLHSYIVVPLKARGRVVGALTLVSAESRRVFGPSDLDVAQSLAGRAAVALDNAQLHADLRRTTERLTVALDAGRLGSWEWDVAANRVYWSPALERIHGIPEGSFGGTFDAYQRDTHPDDKARVMDTVRKFVAGSSNEYEISYRIVRPDGQTRWLDARGTLQRDRDGKPLRLTGVCMDVTERREASDTLGRAVEAQARLNQELQAAQRLFQTLVDNLPELAWSALPDGHIDFYNRRWYEYTGTTFEEMQGWGWRTVHDPVMLDRVTERWQHSLRTGEPFEMEFPLRRADGRLRWFLTRVNPLRDASGSIVRWFGTNTDIHEQREARLRTEGLLAEVSEQVIEMQAAVLEMRAAKEAAERRAASVERPG